MIAPWVRGAAQGSVQAHDQPVDRVGATEGREHKVAQPRIRHIVERARRHRVRVEQRHGRCTAPSQLLTGTSELVVRASKTAVRLGADVDGELIETSRPHGERVALLLNEQHTDVLAALEASRLRGCRECGTRRRGHHLLEFAAAGHVRCAHHRAIIIIGASRAPGGIQIFVALQYVEHRHSPATQGRHHEFAGQPG